MEQSKKQPQHGKKPNQKLKTFVVLQYLCSAYPECAGTVSVSSELTSLSETERTNCNNIINIVSKTSLKYMDFIRRAWSRTVRYYLSVLFL